MNETRQLAQFITEIRYNDFKEEVIEKAKDLILDQLGCELACSILPWSRAVYEYIRERRSERKESTVAHYGLKTLAEDAAFANATFGHGFEMDDRDAMTALHIGSVVIPSALAVGEREDVSGKELLKAIIVGYDVSIRVGTAMQRPPSVRGFHPTPVLGTLGAAAATTAILGLNEDQALNALALAASESGGLREYSETGGSVKRVHAGMAAQGGMRAALLSQKGITGPPTALEGNKGFYKAFAAEYALEAITDELGYKFMVLRLGLKPYACCAAQHCAIDAIFRIVKDHNVEPAEIEEVIVGLIHRHVDISTTIVEPEDITGAQFSGAYGLALTLIKGSNQFKDYTEENLRDPDIINLAKRIRIVPDEELERVHRAEGVTPARVTMILKDGKTYSERVDSSKGTVGNPMTQEELHDKFRGLASMVLPDHQVETIISTVREIERLDTVSRLGDLLITVLFPLIFLLMVSLSPGLCAEPLEDGAKREGKVMFYSQATIPDIRALMAAFEKRHPFIKADFYRANTISLLGKVLAEKRMGQAFADVIAMDGTFLNAYKKEGIAGKYISPESNLIPQGFKDPEGFWTAYYMSYYAFAYNTKMVAKKDLPKTYDDLLQSRWKGKKIGLSDGDVEWYMGMLDFLGEEKGRQFIRRLADQNLMIRTGRTLLANLLAAGEFPLVLGAVHTILERMKVGAPVDILAFPVPTLAGIRMIVIHANAPHPSAAKLLTDFILSKEGQSILSQFSRHPVRMDIPLDPLVEKIMRHSFPIKPRDMELVAGYQKEWSDIFKKR